MRRGQAFFFLFFLASVMLALAGCGRKTRPVPPQTVLPAPIQDLGYSLDEKGVTLQWSYPTRMESGARLAGVDSFEILRAVVPAADYCAGCPVRFGEPVKIVADSLADSERKGGRLVSFTESLLRPGHYYFFKVRSRSGIWQASRDSNIIEFLWDVPPQAPAGLEIAVGDNALVLSWLPPTTLLDGKPVGGDLTYQVYRSEDGRQFTALAGSVAEPRYTDVAVRNGSQYHYKVRTVRQAGDTVLAGPISQEIVATPRDLTPPAPPRHLAAVVTSTGVSLSWEEPGDADVAGYRVYRWQQAGPGPVLLDEVTAPAVTFVDNRPPKGVATWYYTVTAFDLASPANESQPAREAAVQVDR